MNARPLRRWLPAPNPVVLLCLVVLGCYPKAGPIPGPFSPTNVEQASARWPGVTGASLSAGRDLFVARCNSCHDYPDVTAIGDDRWPGILEKMGNKAHLAPPEKEEVLRFVLTARAASPSPRQE